MWPDAKALAHEGDQREIPRGFGRYPPLVRDFQPDNTTIRFDFVRRLHPYELDEVRQIPEYDDIWVPKEDPYEEDIPKLLNKDLLEALDSDEIVCQATKEQRQHTSSLSA